MTAHQGTSEREQRERQREALVTSARERGWVTLDEILNAASSSPVDQDEAVEIAREVRIGVTDDESEGDGEWGDLSRLANEGEAAFTVSREAPVPAEEDFTPESPAAIYLREISRTPLLTAQEEVQLAQEREAGEEAKAQLERGVDDPARRAELEEAIRRGEAARRRLIESNLRLCVSVAKKYLGRGLAFLDLVQEGNIGLQRAVEKYDWRKGFRFSTYAYWWIRQGVTRAVADQGRTIRLPVHVIERLTQLYNTARRLESELGRPPSAEELGRELDIDPEVVRESFRAAKVPISLETPVGESEEATVADFIADAASRAPNEEAEDRVLSDALEQALYEHLSPREARVLKLRFGTEDGRARSLEEIGNELGVSRERIRQIENEAMSKLRGATPFRAKFREYLE